MNTRANSAIAFVTGVALLVLPPRLLAQGNAECEKAVKIIENGRPADTDQWAYGHVRRCGGAGAKAYAKGLTRFATETNVAALEEYVTQIDNWRDASIYQAAVELATNSAATPQARVFAIRHLIVLLNPFELYTYAGLTRKADTTKTAGVTYYQTVGCVGQMVASPRGSLKGEPLPPGYEAEIRSTLSALAKSPSAPGPVRNAAACTLSSK